MPPSRPQDWSPTSREVLADQRAAYDLMRHRCPVAYSDVQGWTLFRHRHVLDVRGSGVHGCPGAPLARMELRVALEEILDGRFCLEPSRGEPPEPADYPASGFQQLPVRLRPLDGESTTYWSTSSPPGQDGHRQLVP